MFFLKICAVLISCLFYLALADTITCADLKTTYNEQECCDQSSTKDTCLRSLPSCTDSTVVAGQICTDTNGKAFVKGLAEAFDLSSSSIILKKSIVPDTNANYDLGSAEYKFRHQYLSD